MRCNAEVFVTMNALLFGTILQALRREKIPYDTRQVPTGLSNRGGNMAGAWASARIVMFYSTYMFRKK